MREFLASLHESGHVAVPPLGVPEPPALDAGARAILAEMDRAARLNLAGDDPPALCLPAAEWAARILHRACQFLVCRDADPPAITRGLGEGCPRARDPSVDYSVDLVFRFLPDLWAIARRAAPADALGEELTGLARAWPLSSVGVGDLEPGLDATLKVGERIFGLAEGRALYAWERSDRGAELVAHGLPGGPALLMHHDHGRLFILKSAWNDGSIPLASVDVSGEGDNAPATPEVHRLAMRCPPLGAFAEGNIAFLVFKPRVDVWNLRTGEKLQELELPSWNEWKGGKYFVRLVSVPGEATPGREWLFLGWEGLIGAIHPVPGETGEVVSLWDREGLGGPWALVRPGQVRRWEEPKSRGDLSFRLPPDAKVRVSRDGHRLLIGDPRARVLDLADLNTRRFGTHPGAAAEALFEPGITPPAYYPVRRRFEAVCALAASHRLLLRSNKGRLVEFALDGKGENTFSPVAEAPSGAEWQPFTPLPLQPERGYSLAVAAWANGSRAFLDSRGLLHLRSADPAVPELTVVLTEATSAAWASTGQCRGHAFFCGDDGPLAPASELREILGRFVAGTRA